MEPVGHGLARRGTGEGVARCTQRCHEDVGTAAIGELHGGAGEVDEELLAGAVDLAHRALQAQRIAPVVLAELAVAPGALLRVLGHVLFPQQHERHAFAAQFLVNAAEVRLGVVAGAVGSAPDQAAFECGLAQAFNRWPVQPGCCGQAGVLGHHALGDVQGSGNAFVRQPCMEFET